MMQKALRSILLLFVGLCTSLHLFGQILYPAEKAVLFTDRSVYIGGEDILFSGSISSADPKNILSEVVYVELITPNGQKINQAKIKLVENKFEGQLNIQADILSGYYFLRAYTKWMRNGVPTDYAFVRLKLINPLTDELLELNDSLIDFISPERESIKVVDDFKISLNKESYFPGEKVKVEMEVIKGACLSIIPSVAEPFAHTRSRSLPAEYSEVIYYPETQGITLSGKVIRKKDKSPLPFHKVSVRFANENDFITVQSDTSGRFYMALPTDYESAELFLIAASSKDDEVELLIDQDYCNKSVAYSVPAFSLETEDKDQVLQMAQSSQLHQVYKENKIEELKAFDSIPFYGEPNRSIVIENFILLDSLEMYFTNLPNAVTIKKRKGKRYFSFTGQVEFQMYDPLVLVDWVPIDEADRVLAVDPSRVERIDLINELYYHGGIIYGGVISIITHNSDFGGLDFPESGMYLNYDFFSVSDFSDKAIGEQNYPFRNTYGWIPDLLSDSYQQPLEFIAPQTKGDYLLIIQAEDENGKNLMISKKFTVE